MDDAKKNRKTNQTYNIMIVGIIVMYICLIVLFLLWIPRSNLPIKANIRSNNTEQTNLRGSISNGNLWKTYYGKTESEVRKIAPMFEEMGDRFVLLDTYEEEDAVIGLIVGFTDEKVRSIDISIMNYTRNSSSVCNESLKDMSRYSATRFAVWMGFNLDNLNSWTYDEYDYGNYGNAYMTSTDLPEAKCSFDLCPSSFIGFMCAGK